MIQLKIIAKGGTFEVEWVIEEARHPVILRIGQYIFSWGKGERENTQNVKRVHVKAGKLIG